MKDKIKVEFEMNQQMCSNCKKSSSEYFELKLQLRFTYFNNLEDIKKEVNKIIHNNLEGINKFEELDNGFDVYFKSLGEKNKISKLFNKRYFVEEKVTKKIVGYNFLSSKDISRHTQLINIINIKVKDKIQIKGDEYYIKAFNKNDLVLRGLKNGEKKVYSYSKIKKYFQKID